MINYIYLGAGLIFALLVYQNYSLRQELSTQIKHTQALETVNYSNKLSLSQIKNSYEAKFLVLKSSFELEKDLNSNLSKSLKKLEKSKATKCVDLYNQLLF